MGYEVLFPVGFPDQGTFEWIDDFLENNPQYVEISDRKLIDWACKSGLMDPVPLKGSRDRPEVYFGVPMLNIKRDGDGSVKHVMRSMASAIPRNYVVMEVKSNLMKLEREQNLKRFPSAFFKRHARVIMGRPKKEFSK